MVKYYHVMLAATRDPDNFVKWKYQWYSLFSSVLILIFFFFFFLILKFIPFYQELWILDLIYYDMGFIIQVFMGEKLFQRSID
jgi:hypothetical protein